MQAGITVGFRGGSMQEPHLWGEGQDWAEEKPGHNAAWLILNCLK